MKKHPRKINPAPSEQKEETTYPLFSFKYLNTTISLKKNKPIAYNFLERVQKLSNLAWEEIHKSSRHQFGYEKINRRQIKCASSIPMCFNDVDEFFVFRASGNNLPFICYIASHIIYPLFIEAKFGDIYNH